ncbi:MAG: ABC transporter ATP-binding protein/permease, partial [Clostridia bacterium]|nr:ABC transporter ATP-binding protein/permease [Clostridia bacterium]
SIMFHKEMQSGKIQSKIMRDVEAVSDLSRTVFEEVVNAIFSMGMALIVIVTKNVWVFLMFVVCVPLAVIIRRLFAGKMRARTHAFRKEIEDTSSAVFDMEELIPISRAHALENKEIKKMTRKVTRVAETGFRFDFIQSFFGSLNWVTFFLFQTICLCFTGFLALRGVISVGEVAMYQTYFSMLTGIVSGLVALLPTISRGSESILSIGEILSAYDVEDNSNKLKIHELSGKYEFRDISFQYDERTDVLEHLNLTVKPGETIALVGESGSGKTTIINLVIGFYKAQHGQLLVDDHNIDDLDLHAYRRMISIVPQNSILFSGSIRDNIVYGKSHISEERLQEVIKMAQLESVIEKLPNGLDTLVGEHGDKLSGGQKQRISIARAIIREPKVIIFDEATSALDSVTEREIQTAIDNLTRDRTTFIVAHRLSTIKNADKIAVIADGECVEFGTYDELMAKKGAFFRYKEMQS